MARMRVSPATTSDNVVVDVQSSWFSKINWAQAIGFLSAVLVYFFGPHYAIPAETQLSIITVITGVQATVTWILRTWFTKTVTPSSIPSP